MQKDKLIEILEEEFPNSAKALEDFVGEQVEIKSEIKKILVTLDITIDIISQAIHNNVDLIISHHPLFFGKKNELLKSDSFLKSKYDLLKQKNIGAFIIHTNADYNPNSIAYAQAVALNLENIRQDNNNLSVSGELKNEEQAINFINDLKKSLELTNIEFRSNFDINRPIKKIKISSGAGGNIVKNINDNTLCIIGEVKHHE